MLWEDLFFLRVAVRVDDGKCPLAGPSHGSSTPAKRRFNEMRAEYTKAVDFRQAPRVMPMIRRKRRLSV